MLHIAVQAEESSNLASLVNDPKTMLTPDRFPRVCRMIFAIRHYLALE